MSSISSSSIIPSFLIASSFKEKEAFKEIKELDFLSYYKDFNLILCSICKLGLVPSSFKRHLIKHIKLYKPKQKSLILSKAIIILNNLEVSSLKESLDLINLYTTSNSSKLLVFKELEIKDLFICNLNLDSTCSVICTSKYSIKRHIREIHSSINSSISPYKVIKGQSLENNKFSFKVILNSSSISPIISNRSRSNSLEQDSLLEQAKESFFNKYNKKEEEFNKELSSFKLDPKEKLSPF
jgi:Orsellinic acid/F9775 biosynthesis cluster protein D